MFTTYMALGTVISQADPLVTIGAGAVAAMTGLLALALAAAIGATAELRAQRRAARALTTGDVFGSPAPCLAA
jgi:uncharacterized membrane protein YedE/YeeE